MSDRQQEDPKVSVIVDGVKVAFCCGGCKGKASKVEGDEQIALVFGDKAFDKGFKAKKAKKKNKEGGLGNLKLKVKVKKDKE
jgi:hypothetical protein